MQWFSGYFFLGILLLIFSTATQYNSNRSLSEGDITSSKNENIQQEIVGTTNAGRFKYQDGEVILLQNQRKLSDFFFTPFPHVEPNLTECHDDEFSGRTELTLVVSLYTTNLTEFIERHIQKRQDICHTERCDVSLVPMHSIRLFQKGFRTVEASKKFTLDDRWHGNTQLRQMVEFIFYTYNMSICESLKHSITSHCRVSNFEVHYSLEGQQTTSRTLEVTTEHVTKTSMYNQIKSQFPENNRDTVALTGDDYKNLLSETMDQIKMNIRVEEGYEDMQDPVGIDRLLDRQLQYKQVRLTTVNDHLWDSLYWTPELTRPDRLAKVLNKILKQDATDSDKFRYDFSQADEASKQDLKLQDKQNFDHLQKHLATKSQNTTHKSDVGVHFGTEAGGSFLGLGSANMKVDVDVNVHNQNTDSRNSLNDGLVHNKTDMNRFNSTNNERKNSSTVLLQRKDAEKLVHFLSEHLEIEGDIIKPKPIDVTLVKVGSLKSSTKLFSNMVYVKTRTKVHTLPLRCPYEYRRDRLANDWLAEKYHRLSNAVEELSKNLTKSLKVMESSIGAIESSLAQKLVSSESSLNQKLFDYFNSSKMLMNAIESQLIDKIEQSANATNSTIDQMENRLYRIEKGIFMTEKAISKL
ncbi:unnamed protein product [Rotaria socialis]